MSACEIVNVDGFVSQLNRKRTELDLEVLRSGEGCFRVGEAVRVEGKARGKTEGRINRFCRSGGQFFADVELRLACMTRLYMAPVVLLESKDTHNCKYRISILDLDSKRSKTETQLSL